MRCIDLEELPAAKAPILPPWLKELRICAREPKSQKHRAPLDLLGVVETAQTHVSLQSVGIDFQHSGSLEGKRTDSEREAWKPLDTILTDRARFPALVSFDICVFNMAERWGGFGDPVTNGHFDTFLEHVMAQTCSSWGINVRSEVVMDNWKWMEPDSDSDGSEFGSYDDIPRIGRKKPVCSRCPENVA